jgi:hypothetical protein
LLDRNAFLWLVSRERIKPRYAWALVVFFCGMYAWLIASHPNLSADLPINAAIILTVHATLKLWLASEVCSRLIEDKRSGALELLLTTPVGAREIARGQSLALRRIFLWPILFLAAAELFLGWKALGAGWRNPSPEDRALTFAAAAVVLVLDAWALKWIGLWRSMWSKGVERALLSTVAKGLALPCLVFATIYSGVQFFGGLTGRPPSYRSLLTLWFGINLVFALALGLRSRWCFLRHFRECVAGRFEGREPSREVLAPTRSSGPARPWWQRRPGAAAAAACLLLLLAGLGGRRAYWQWKVHAELKRIRAEGLPASLAELQAAARSPAAGRDAGRALMEAGQPAESGLGFALWQNVLETGSLARAGFLPNWQLDVTLEANRRQLAALWSLTNKAGYSQPPGMETWNIGKHSALGCLDYLDALDRGDRERALRDVRGLIALARALRSSPRFAAQKQACDVLRDLNLCLQRRPSFAEAEWKKIATALSGIDDDQMLLPVLHAQRVYLAASGPGNYFYAGNPAGANPALQWTSAAMRAIGSEHKRLHGLLLDCRNALGVAGKPHPERLDALQSWRLPPFLPRNAPTMSTIDPLRARIAQVVWGDAEFTARARVLQTAVAFMRYHKRRGFLPDNLSELVPDYLEAIPQDPFSGQPLAIKKGKTWIVYSVGMNRADDGGVHRLYSEATDIAFRYEF